MSDVSLRTLVGEIAGGRRSAAEVCRAALERIDASNAACGALQEVTHAYARERARAIDERVARGEETGPLAGVPIALKDNICTRFSRTTAGSRMLAEYRSPYDATVVERLERSGAVIVGKTNMDEFAMGSTTENSAFGPARNPWDPQRVPGGSSGGSAVAVASGMTPAALGSDTGGSVRQPAALCGLVGLKPTYGRVSRYGLLAYGSSLDQIGPLTRSVEDAALVLGVIAGRDERDATSAAEPTPDYVAALADDGLAGRAGSLRIGVPREYFGEGLDPQVRAAVEQALEVYRRLGARLVELSMPHARYTVACYYVIATAECSSNLARYDGVHYGYRAAGAEGIVDLVSRSRSEGFGAEVKRRLMLGTFALSAGHYEAYYDKALRVRRLIKGDFDAAFEQVDVIVSPTTPTPAHRLGEKSDEPLAIYLLDVYTLGVNLAGLPAISVPCGLSDGRLPIGLQLIGPPFGEIQILQAARLFERETHWAGLRPGAA